MRLILGSLLTATLCFSFDGIPSLGSSQSDDSYEGSSGRTYQYDMSNQNDRQRYSTDTGAQMRDNSANGYVDRYYDRAKGQYGGGIYDD